MAEPRPVLLVVDDEPAMAALVERFARGRGFDVLTRLGGRSILDELPSLRADAAVVDLRLPGISGLDVLRLLRQIQPACQVVLMTAHASVDTAVDAVKLGALDYLSKPLDFDRLGELLTGVCKGLDRRRRLLVADQQLASEFECCGMIGRSPVMQELFDRIRRLAPHIRTALVTGETGTGKELVARALHKMSGRGDRRFVACNCSAIVESLCESELFGHVRGAFTGAHESKAGLFELADGGTLFLDEIGELPLVMQAKLLRVVEGGDVQRVGATDPRRVDVRVIAATNRDLFEEVRHGRFRQDLYYRLNIVEVILAPLRERPADIPYLSAAFVQEFAKRFGKPLLGMTAGAEQLLVQAPWPGNVRELRNTLERACMLSEGRVLSEREVLEALGGGPRRAPGEETVSSAARDREPALERAQVERVLQRCGGNKSAAARELRLSRRALYRRLDAFGLR